MQYRYLCAHVLSRTRCMEFHFHLLCDFFFFLHIHVNYAFFRMCSELQFRTINFRCKIQMADMATFLLGLFFSFSKSGTVFFFFFFFWSLFVFITRCCSVYLCSIDTESVVCILYICRYMYIHICVCFVARALLRIFLSI